MTYYCAIFLEKIKKSDLTDEEKVRKKKITMVVSLVINLGILFFFKYFNFAMDSIVYVMKALHMSVNTAKFDVLLPVGISFYTLQAVGYTIDVYRDDISAENNFITYALFVSFFPQLVAGPIERSGNLIKQIASYHKFDFDNMREGILLMIWGFFLKIVVADRICIMVDTVFGNYTEYSGFYFTVAVFLFAIQIYCDFYGYSVIAMGTARMLGVTLMENFDAPFLARNTKDLWRRWHISLTSWFTDYLYIPLGGSRKGKLRHYINILAVFTVSGLWHGASWNYVLWGFMSGLFQLIGAFTMKIRTCIAGILKVDVKSVGHKMLQTLGTFYLFMVACVPFRSSDMKEAFYVYKEFFTAHNPWIFSDGSLYALGLDEKNVFVAVISMLILLVGDICKYNKICIRKIIMKQDWWFRAAVIVVCITLVMIFGKWGPSFDNKNFAYFQF